jgi:hypothetical protein
VKQRKLKKHNNAEYKRKTGRKRMRGQFPRSLEEKLVAKE